MSNAFADQHQDNYFDAEEAEVAAHTAQSKFSREVTVGSLIRDHERFPDTAFPFSGDHLGAFSHREEHYTRGVGWESGEEVRRERIHNSDIDLWAMVTA